MTAAAALNKFAQPEQTLNPNEITATIKNARFLDIGGRQIVGGQIYDDVRGRWPDGTTIYTSSIQDIEDDIVITRNSRYRIEKRV